MLKTADGSISGSLKVIESLKGKKKGKKGKDGAEWTWKEQVDLVKFTPVPIEQSLLRLDNELSALAVECFLCLMRYMGDQPLPPDMSEVKCVYTILMVRYCVVIYPPLTNEFVTLRAPSRLAAAAFFHLTSRRCTQLSFDCLCVPS